MQHAHGSQEYTRLHANNCASLSLLYFTVFSAIIEEMGCHPIKGGPCDSYGLSYSKGGCEGTETPRRDGQADASGWKDAGLQVRQCLAHRQGRVRRVENATETSVQRTGSGGLNNWLVSAATRHSAIPWNRLTERRCQSLLHAHYSNESPRMTTICHDSARCNGQEVAREGIHL